MKRIAVKHFLYSFLLLLMTGSSLHLAATTPPDDKFNKKKYLKAADEAFKSGNIYAATDLYLEILKNAPEEKSVLYNLGQSYLLERDYENAATYFQRAYDT